jgi:hypothetical protein
MADDALLSRMAALEARIADLQQELARSAVGGFRSMRDARRCPACGGEHLLHIRAAMEWTQGGFTPLALHHIRKRWYKQTAKGPIEYFVCRTCRLIESHAIDLEGVEPDGEGVIAIDPEPDSSAAGPFR